LSLAQQTVAANSNNSLHTSDLNAVRLEIVFGATLAVQYSYTVSLASVRDFTFRIWAGWSFIVETCFLMGLICLACCAMRIERLVRLKRARFSTVQAPCTAPRQLSPSGAISRDGRHAFPFAAAVCSYAHIAIWVEAGKSWGTPALSHARDIAAPRSRFRSIQLLRCGSAARSVPLAPLQLACARTKLWPRSTG
jgi:hypothetical protein